MDLKKIIYPSERLLSNPKIFIAIANYLEGPEWEVIADAFYELMEEQFSDPEVEGEFKFYEVAFRQDPENEEVFQVVLANGDAIELRPTDGVYSTVQSENELGIVSVVYGRLVKAIEEERPDLKGDISLEVPTPGNGYLRDESGEAFRGTFSLLSDPAKTFKFVVDIIDLSADEMKATVTPE